MSITKQEFNHQCIKFASRCQDLNDSWSLFSENSGRLTELCIDNCESLELLNSSIMLTKNDILTTAPDVIRTCEYSILYSESFEVPVMYFCLSNQDGSPLDLNHLIASPGGCKDLNLCQIINQVEHPILFRPFFMIHPCRTRNFMEPHTKINPCNYLVCWLSTVGTLVGLKLDRRLAESKEIK